MIRVILIVLSILIALIQALSFPWLSLFGSPVPLLLVALLLCGNKFTNQLAVMGVAGGMALDIVSPTPFGLWTFYYFCAGFMLRLIIEKPRATWWWALTWLSAAIALNPLYAQAMAGQINLEHWVAEAIGPVTVLTIAAIVPTWLLRKPVEQRL